MSNIEKVFQINNLTWFDCKSYVYNFAKTYLEDLNISMEKLTSSWENGLSHISLTQLETNLNNILFLDSVNEINIIDKKFINSMAKKILSETHADVLFVLQEDPAANHWEEAVYCYPGVQSLHIYRLAHFLWTQGSHRISRLLSAYAREKFSVDIHPAAQIASPCFFDHASGIVIGETAVLGKYVSIYHGVTIGANRLGKTYAGVKRHPTILDNVKIGAYSCVLGGETIIGRGVTIGAGCLVTESIPDQMVRVQSKQQRANYE